MDSSNLNPAPSEAHPETMDFLSRAWCNFAVQTLQPSDHDQSLVLLDNSMKKLDLCDPFTKIEKNNVKMDDSDFKSFPPWKSNDVKSWIRMQQAMHPELNYNSCFRKKWKVQLPWKIVPFKNVSIKKWWREFKQKRKEDVRLQKAGVHAAISVAGIAAALAAVAAENTKRDDSGGDQSGAAKEAAVASAAALVAAQCAKVAEAMGAKKEQLSGVIGSAMSSTATSDILTLTAAATTSLRGAATLKARSGSKISKLNGGAPVLPIEDNDVDFNFEKCRSLLARGTNLGVETPDRKYKLRSVSVVLDSQAKVILKLRKLNLLKSKKESIIIDMHAEFYTDSEEADDHDEEEEEDDDDDTCYLIVLTTNIGTIKLDMGDDYQLYKTWTATINHMLTLSPSFPKYQLLH